MILWYRTIQISTPSERLSGRGSAIILPAVVVQDLTSTGFSSSFNQDAYRLVRAMRVPFTDEELYVKQIHLARGSSMMLTGTHSGVS